MADYVYKMADGRDSMAYIGDTPWHKKGQVFLPGDDHETRVKKSGLDFEILEAVPMWLDPNDEIRSDPEHKIYYRGDTMESISIVHKSHNLDQPRMVLDFFEEVVESGGMTIESAGSLKNGRVIWALARIGKDFDVYDGVTGDLVVDPMLMYALLASSCDRSLSRTGRLTGTRVICWNTLNYAYQGGVNIVKVTHRAKFDEAKQDEVRKGMGLVYDEIDLREKETKAMATASLSKEDAVGFFLTLLSKRNEDGTLDVSEVTAKSMDTLYEAYKTSPGAGLPTAKDTLWGAVNAVTYNVDHNPNARSDETRLNNAWFGQGNKMKADAYSLATDVVMEKVKVSSFGDLLNKPVNLSDGNLIEGLVKDMKFAA